MAMVMISYAQNGEDVVLNRVFGGRATGFYLDVGANDPTRHSVTRHFHELGWRGVNLEPEAEVFLRLRNERPEDVNLNVGISDLPGSLTFFEASDASGWSTFSSAHAAELRKRGLRVEERSVPVRTLAEVCAEHVGEREIDFLKVDAEGFERRVIRGGDWTRWRPRVVLVEAHAVEAWEPELLGQGYSFGLDDGINRFYVRQEDAALLPLLGKPANPTDDFIPHRFLERIESLEERLAVVERVGPTALRLALWMTRAAGRHPRLRSIVRRVLSRAG